MCVIEQDSRNITVRLTQARWRRLMEMEQAYKVARAIARAEAQVQNAPSMTVAEALAHIDSL